MSNAPKRGAGTFKIIAPSVPQTVLRESRASRFTPVPDFNSRAMQVQVRALRERVTASPEAANTFLKGAGILTPTGRLSKRFGG